MSIPVIILLIILGIFLFLVEFLLIPGITVAGIGGAILLIGSIIMGYKYHGTTTGNYILLGTLLLFVLTLVFVLKGKTWQRLSLKTVVDGKVNVIEENAGEIVPGDEGVTISRINPMGKVKVKEKVYEAKSQGGYIDQHTKVIIIKVMPNHIIVKPKN
ncbi:MAG: NfeD family protein [Bacteroidales bacterium]|nr:NfeD family protein [Bacteroidales bacterium]